MKVQKIALGAMAAMLVACAQPAQKECNEGCNDKVGLCAKSFGEAVVNGDTVKLFTLRNDSTGMVAQFTNIGAKLVSLYVADKDGNLGDVVCGYATAAEYAACDNAAGKGEPFYGATIGRYGNRIAGGKFSIDGTEYQIDVNENGVNSLHGGHLGYYSVVFNANKVDDKTIEFTYKSADGEMGYPGNLDVKVTYSLCDCGSIKIAYEATTDKPTVVNLTNHSFFNLAGEGDTTIVDEQIQILADQITPVDKNLIPTGEFMNVEGTPFDLRELTVIGDKINEDHEQIKLGGGFDHNWVLSSEINPETGLRTAAKVVDPQSGRVMTVLTNEPGIQFYAGNFMNGSQTGKCGKPAPYRSALCLETQHFPDSPNHANFPSTVLRPGETYNSVCVYKFEVVK
ncbi:MAG: galactose mutarotase [Bacteroidales bacterium]|nr:galactose mutarotase [Bacteroidales bacterium]